MAVDPFRRWIQAEGFLDVTDQQEVPIERSQAKLIETAYRGEPSRGLIKVYTLGIGHVPNNVQERPLGLLVDMSERGMYICEHDDPPECLIHWDRQSKGV